MKTLYALFLIIIAASYSVFAQSAWQSCDLSPYITVNDITIKNGHLFVATNDGVFMNQPTLVEGYDWKKISAGLPDQPILSIAFSVMNRIVVTTGTDVYYTDNDGDSWTKYNNGLVGINFKNFKTDYETDIYAATDRGVYKSTDHGSSWNLFGMEGSNVLSVGIELNQNDIYAGTIIQNKSGIFKTTDHGTTWNQVWNKIVNTNVITTTPIGIFAGCYSQDPSDASVRLSTDKGASWTDLGLSNCSVSSLVYAGANLIFAGIENKSVFGDAKTYYGVQLSNDGGVSWKDWNDELSDLDIHAMYFVNGTLLAGTSAGLYFRAVNAETGVNDLNVNNSNDLTILPNPVISGGKFRIESHLNGESSISIYNLQGTCVYLVNKENSGSIIINPGRLSPGLYTAVQNSGNRVLRTKLIVTE